MNKLIHGDCLKEMVNIPDKSVDLVLSDPPYQMTKCKWDTIIPFNKYVLDNKSAPIYEQEFLLQKVKLGSPYVEAKRVFDTNCQLGMWDHLKRITKPNGAILLFSQTSFDKVLANSNIKMLKQELIWEKGTATGHLNSKKMHMKCHENILVFYDKLPTYNPQMTDGHNPMNAVYENQQQSTNVYGKHTTTSNNKGTTQRYPRDVLKYSVVTTNTFHSTQKPIDLLEYLITTFSNPHDTVLDFAMGPEVQ